MTTLPVSPSTPEKPNPPLADRLVWLLKGFAWPCFSLDYYVEATGKRLIVGILFLALFAMLQTAVAGAQMVVGLQDARAEMEEGYANSGIPVVIINNGIASAKPSEPFAWGSGQMIVAIDTTGATEQIDRRYGQGFLLTRTDLHVLNNGQYQVLPLQSLHESFGNPIVINQETVMQLWNTVMTVLVPLGFIAIYFFSVFIRLVYFLVIGVIVWGIVSIKHKGYDFAKVMMVGLFASVPTWYITFLLKQVGIGFFLLYTIVISIIWSIAMRAVLRSGEPVVAAQDVALAARPIPRVFELPHEVIPTPPDDEESAANK